MIDTASATETAKFVFEALRKPEDALARENMGDLHAALAPHLRNWMDSSADLNRKVLMVSPAGSVNYDLVIETSDLDMKAVYLPDFEDFYRNKFPKFSFTTDRFDCELHPAQSFIEHVLKGNINFFEFLYSNTCLATPDFAGIMKLYLQPLVEMNVKMTAMASFFTAEQCAKGSGYSSPGDEWGYKRASMAIRTLAFLCHLLDTGEFDIVPTGALRDVILKLKRDEMGSQEWYHIYEELHDTAKTMMFKSFRNGGDFEWEDRIQDMDGTGTNRWVELRTGLDDSLIKMVREPIELAYRDKLQAAGWHS